MEREALKTCMDLQGRKNHCIAVIGDGAITGGMAYEAMNHAGFLDKNMIVVLNDNQQVSRSASQSYTILFKLLFLSLPKEVCPEEH